MSPAADCSSRYYLKLNSITAEAALATCNYYSSGIEKGIKRNFRDYSNPILLSEKFASDKTVLVGVPSN